MVRQYYVYIITNVINTVLYTGVTNDIIRRVTEHKMGLAKGFSKRYNLCKLVYYEVTNDIKSAIEREKQIKNLDRRSKQKLISVNNKEWRDLFIEL